MDGVAIVEENVRFGDQDAIDLHRSPHLQSPDGQVLAGEESGDADRPGLRGGEVVKGELGRGGVVADEVEEEPRRETEEVVEGSIGDGDDGGDRGGEELAGEELEGGWR